MRARPGVQLLPLAALVGVVAAIGCQGQYGTRGNEPIAPFPSPRPTYGATVTQAHAPAPISGGTLLIAGDGKTAIAADPDRDRVLVADLNTGGSTAIELAEGDEPGRAAEDDDGRVHVLLRRGGAIATIDLATRTLIKRRNVCPAPRGITWVSGHKSLFVACAGGELVAFGPDSDTPTWSRSIDRDLRDVVVGDGGMTVTRFRSAEILRVSFDGTVLSRLRPAPLMGLSGTAEPEVAWRTVAIGAGRILMLHQRARDPRAQPISTSSGGYSEEGGAPSTPEVPREPCGLGIVHSAVTVVHETGGMKPLPPIGRAVLAVDVAAAPAGEQVAVVAAGNGHTQELPQIFLFDMNADVTDMTCLRAPRTITPKGQAVAAAYVGADLVVQLREPAALVRYNEELAEVRTISLGGESREDTGHAVFHSNSGGFIACASCHPEASDDGHVWAFEKLGPRRTQNLRGGVLASAPFHWNGELRDLSALMGDVFARRMSGGSLGGEQVTALGRWVDAIPHLPQSAPIVPESAARGRALFFDAKVGCATCHGAGNTASVDVGTGGLFQVPSLTGVAFRAPYMHTGCATTLAARFDPSCGGGDQHGVTSHLGATQIADLVAYLESL